MSKERQDRAARAEQMRREREKAAKKQRNVISIVIVAVVLALIIGGGFAIKSASDKNAKSTELVAPKGATKDYGITYDTKVATGKATANPVVVTLYEDFQCPACKAFEEANGPFLKQAVAAGDITIDYRPIAFLDGASSTRYSTRSLNAAMCSLDTTDVKTYIDVHDVLFANQPDEGGAGLDNAELTKLTEQGGAKDLKSCINSEKFGPWIKDATAAASKAKVSGTPTVMIAGKKVEGAVQNGQAGLPTSADLQKAIAVAAKS